jgi:hypothetical protein
MNYVERIQKHAHAPRDVVKVNEALLLGEVSEPTAREEIKMLDNSWWGVEGQFHERRDKNNNLIVPRRQAMVFPSVVVPTEADHAFRPISDSRVAGWLNGLNIVQVSEVRVSRQVSSELYSGPMVVAELHQARELQDEETMTGLIAYCGVSFGDAYSWGSYKTISTVRTTDFMVVPEVVS